MHRQIGQRLDHADPVLARFAHADDAAAADMDAGRAHVLQRFQPIVIGTGGDDLAVEIRRGVEVVVVIVEAGLFQLLRLRFGQHAERHAGLEAKGFDPLDHRANSVEIAILGRAPGGAHAKAAGAGIACGTRLGEHLVERHQLLGIHAGVVMGALRTIGAVLGAAAGLDREQRRHLHRRRIEGMR